MSVAVARAHRERPAYRTFPAAVSAVQRLTPHFTRITFHGHELADFGTDGLDQRLKVVLPLPGLGLSTFPRGDDWYAQWRELPEGARNPFRTYTVRAVRPADGDVDVDFVTHGDAGPASAWAARARPGDEVALVGPDATSAAPPTGIEWKPGDAETVLLAGDETAVPAISAILESLPASVRGSAFLEIPCAADRLPLEAPEGVEVRWLPRAVADQGYGSRLVPAVSEWADRFVGPPQEHSDVPDVDVDVDGGILWDVPPVHRAASGLYAWIAGEAAAVTSIRRHLVSELGVDRRRVAFMGYWRVGRAEV